MLLTFQNIFYILKTFSFTVNCLLSHSNRIPTGFSLTLNFSNLSLNLASKPWNKPSWNHTCTPVLFALYNTWKTHSWCWLTCMMSKTSPKTFKWHSFSFQNQPHSCPSNSHHLSPLIVYSCSRYQSLSHSLVHWSTCNVIKQTHWIGFSGN